MKLRASRKVKSIGKYSDVLMLATLFCGLAIFNIASASDNPLNALISNGTACTAGFANIWIVTKTCDIGGRMDIKVDDAIHIQCDSMTKEWSVDFYEEPLGADPNSISSDAIRYPVCPGNGHLQMDDAGHLVLRCNFWEAQDNLSKQLEFAMSKAAGQGYPGERTMQWKVIERDNPNVICGISGRPDNGSATGGSRTIVGD